MKKMILRFNSALKVLFENLGVGEINDVKLLTGGIYGAC